VYVFQGTIAVSLLNAYLVYTANNSYGSYADVWKSWTGITIGASNSYKAPTTLPTNIAGWGDFVAYGWSTALVAATAAPATGWTSDYANLMWKDVA